MIIGTAGHIDHGKTALIKALTGVNTDRLKDEQARGISIELGFAYLPVPDIVSPERADQSIVGFVDVPGHEKFVPTMVAGAAGIDFAMLVVAANDGVMPQTQEHLQVLDLLGINEGIVALNKIDLVDDARRRVAEKQIKEMLAGTSLEGIDILPVSATQRIGIDDLKQRLWDEAVSRPEKSVSGTFRLAVDRCFTMQGAGTIVTGLVRSGQIAVGDKVMVLPSGQSVRVRSLHVQGQDASLGYAGQRCALNLASIDKSGVGRGDWLVDPKTASVASRFDAEIRLLASEQNSLRTWSSVQLHVGTTRVPARIVLLEGSRLLSGEKAVIQVVTDHPLPLVHGDLFVIRAASVGRTIGGGHVIDPGASRFRRHTSWRQATREALREPDSAVALDNLLSLTPGIVDFEGYVADRGLSDAEAQELLELLAPEAFLVGRQKYVARADSIAAIEETIVTQTARFHTENPDLPAMATTLLQDQIETPLSKPMLRIAIAILVEKGSIAIEGGGVRLPTHSSSMRAADRRIWDQISKTLKARRHNPPPLHELASEISQPVSDVRKVCKTLARMRVLVEVKKDRYYLATALVELAELAHQVAKTNQDARFSVADFRDAACCGRSPALHVLEYFDRHSITVRRGDTRIVSNSAKDVFGDVPTI